MRFPSFLLPGFFVLLVAVLAACSGDADTATGGVASAADLDETIEDAQVVAAEADSVDPDAPATIEEAQLAMAECMRENDWPEFPDPVIGANGTPDLRQAILESGIDFTDPTFREQIDVCREEIGAENFAGAGNREEIRAQVQERLLDYTQCLRDEGLDVGDLGNPGGNGQAGAGQNGDGEGTNRGRAQAGGASLEDRSARVAAALGIDADDPATAAALETCDPALQEAFAGIGGGGQQAADNS